VLEHACRQGGSLAAEHGTWISVNLSARQVAQHDLLEVVATALRAGRLNPSSLCLELTETALLGVTPGIVRNLQRLDELGVRLALDDFGTGYSSFQHLKDFPIDMVKIDRSFVANLGRGEQDAAIIESVVSMASALGLGVIAEGVESEAQAEALRRLGCPLAQGYHFGPPA
jgi:EAL domain-containing protein (putative c-di-GMP-specific phosphodiesterase class I)